MQIMQPACQHGLTRNATNDVVFCYSITLMPFLLLNQQHQSSDNEKQIAKKNNLEQGFITLQNSTPINSLKISDCFITLSALLPDT